MMRYLLLLSFIFLFRLQTGLELNILNLRPPQDSEWEEIQAEDVETDQDLVFSSGVTSFGRPTYEQLEAMAKVFDEVWLKEHEISGFPFFFFFFFNVCTVFCITN